MSRLASAALRGTRATVTVRPAWVTARSMPPQRAFRTDPSLRPHLSASKAVPTLFASATTQSTRGLCSDEYGYEEVRYYIWRSSEGQYAAQLSSGKWTYLRKDGEENRNGLAECVV